MFVEKMGKREICLMLENVLNNYDNITFIRFADNKLTIQCRGALNYYDIICEDFCITGGTRCALSETQAKYKNFMQKLFGNEYKQALNKQNNLETTK